MVDNSKQKVYGLSFPTRKPKDTSKSTIQSIFAEQSDEETEAPQLKPLPSSKTGKLDQAKLHRKTKCDYEKALEQDPSVFQYDEIYDNIKSEKDRQFDDVLQQPKRQSKYVEKLIKTSSERKLERELCSDRKAQREIEAEKELFGDKEAFVTSAYKEKLAQLNQLVNKRREEELRERRMDITAQDGLGGFYRYMYQHGLDGSSGTGNNDSSRVASSSDNTGSNLAPNSESDSKDSRGSGVKRLDDRKEFGRMSNEGQLRREKSSTRKTYEPSDCKANHSCHSHHTHSGDRQSRRSGSGERSHHKGESRSADSCEHVRSHTSRPANSSSDTRKDRPISQPNERVKPLNISDSDQQPAPPKISEPPQTVPRDPNFLYARPRVTTDEQIEEARQRYFARKAAGITPVIVESDSE